MPNLMDLVRGRVSAREHRSEFLQVGSLEQPQESMVLGLSGGQIAAAGVTVNNRTASGIPVVYACNKVICQDVAKTPLKLKKRGPDGARVDDTSHPVYALLHDLANPVMTAFEFKETMQSAFNYDGNAYAKIERGPDNLPKALWPLDPSRMTVFLNGRNQLQYDYAMPSGPAKSWVFDPMNPPVLHLRQNAVDGIHGRGPIRVLRETLGIAIAQDRYEGRFYGQGGHPRILLSTPNALNAESARRVRADFEALTQGEQNWHRAVVLDHDLKPIPSTLSNRDAQFIEAKRLGRDEICGAFRVPPHKVANLEKSTNNNIEHQAIEYVSDCLLPIFVCWQQAIARDLLNAKTFETHFAVFVVSSLIRGDQKATNDALHIQRQDGVITANQWLAAIDADTIIPAELGGNDYLINGNMMPVRAI